MSQWFICFENTGSYSSVLFNWLCTQGIRCRQENPMQIKHSLGLRRGKSDKADAKSIAQYASRKRDELKCSEPVDPSVAQLRKLLSRRRILIKQKLALKVSLSEHKKDYTPQTYRIFSWCNKSLIEEYKKQIKQVERLMLQHIASDPKLKRNYQLVTSVIGIGLIIGCCFLAYTNNFTSFINARKFASYCGVAPFPHTSGTSYKGRARVSHIANKRIKALFTNGANSAIQYDKELKLYYQRRIAEGKEEGSVLNAVKNKLIQRAFAVAQRETPYVPLMTYA